MPEELISTNKRLIALVALPLLVAEVYFFVLAEVRGVLERPVANFAIVTLLRAVLVLLVYSCGS